ncbi:MAG TPA: PKD domain-containing protein, partial [Acidimicrobiales bacterium]|nr:PKD domain-containing protein [Acidimicrobiales bacterium]
FLIDVGAATQIDPPVTATIEPAVNVTTGSLVTFTAHTSSPLSSISWWLDGRSADSPDTVMSAYAPAAGPVGSANFTLWETSSQPGQPSLYSSASASLVVPDFFAVEAGGFVPLANALTLNATGGPAVGTPPFYWSGEASAHGPGPVQFNWTLGDGQSVAGPSVFEEYPSAGNFTANVTATDAWDDSAQLPFGIESLYVEAPIVASAHAVQTEGPAPLTVEVFANVSGGYGAPYQFELESGTSQVTVSNSSGSATIALTFSTVGSYNLTLWVTTGPESPHLVAFWTVDVLSPTGGSGSTSSSTTLALEVGTAVAAVVAIGLVVWFSRRPPRATPSP